MSRRVRAAAFALIALSAAATAASIADRYGSTVARGYGPLRPVVVANGGLPAHRPIGIGEIEAALTVRRVPEMFVPSGALSSPQEALGLAPRAVLPAGSYLVAAQLSAPRQRRRAGPALGGGRHPVEVSVSGADALAAVGPIAAGAKVDVVVTSEPGVAERGRTYVAAAAVPLLALGPGEDGPGPHGLSVAMLGLTKPQALRVIAAESFARKVTLLPVG